MSIETPDGEHDHLDGKNARETDVRESDPNADSSEGLAGGMGVSSERVGSQRGDPATGTNGTMATHLPTPAKDAAPEQSADPAAGPEVHPDQPLVKDHGQQG